MSEQDFDVLVIGAGPRRLCCGHPRGAARIAHGLCRAHAHPRRHLPQRGLHPVEGAAAHLGGIRPRQKAPRAPRRHGLGRDPRSRQDDGPQGPGRGRAYQGRGRAPGEERRDPPGGPRAAHRPRHGGDRGFRAAHRHGRGHRDRDRQRLLSARRRRGRRRAHRHLDRRAGAAGGARAHGSDRRRLHRPRNGLGLEPARRQGHGD